MISLYECVTDMVTHIYLESAKLMKGNAFENDFYFYHNELLLMKAKECRQWVEENGMLKHWILPCNRLNAKTTYEGMPVGNSPELMPIDCSLF